MTASKIAGRGFAMPACVFAAALSVVVLTPAPSSSVQLDRTDITPRCATEDASGRCVWDARHMGNGDGRSFVVRKSGRVVYVTHARAHLLATTTR